MNAQRIKAAAQLLLAARNHEVALAQLPEEHQPRDADEAYAIQDEVMRALGPVGGWKVHAGTGISASHREPLRVPHCAPVPAQAIFAVPYHFFDLLMAGAHDVEVVLALRMKHDLPPRPATYIREEVQAAVATIHPAIELVSSRVAGAVSAVAADAADSLASLADALGNCALIYGPGRSDLTRIGQSLGHAELYFNGLDVDERADEAPAVDLWPQVAWLANHLCSRCGGLKAGQLIVLGARQSVAGAPARRPGNAALTGIGAAVLSLVQA